MEALIPFIIIVVLFVGFVMFDAREIHRIHHEICAHQRYQ